MAALVGLFIWSTINTPESASSALFVPTVPGVMAGLTLAVVLVSYFAAPLNTLTQSARINYGLAAGTLCVLVATTGGITAHYFSLFAVALLLSGVLGLQTLTAGVVFVGGFMAHQFFIEQLTLTQLLPAFLVLALVLIANVALWLRITPSQDVTPEDKSYHELAAQLDKAAGTSEVVINAIADGVISLDGKGTVRLINPAAQRLIGWGDQDAVGINYASVLKLITDHGEPVTNATNPIAQTLANNQSAKADTLSIQTQSGKSFLAGVSVNPIVKSGDGVIIVFRDITAEKQDERQRAEFISTASHEMRTPVASIEGYLGLALNPQTATVDARALSYISKAQESTKHLGRLFSDLLDISKADDHRLKNDPRAIDVVTFIQDIVEGLTPNANKKKLELIYKPGQTHEGEDGSKRLTPLYYANVDNDHLREIVQNLIENAIKYTPQGEITVDLSGDERQIIISVADTGIGIPKEDVSHLFQKFYRVDNSETREIGGTGLGLYLCRRLAETIGGRLWVESEYKKGSTFFLSIPRLKREDAQLLMRQQAPSASNSAESATSSAQPVSDTPVTTATDQLARPSSQPTSSMPRQRTFTNTPLTDIEANPEKYAQQLREQISLNVPPRDPPK